MSNGSQQAFSRLSLPLVGVSGFALALREGRGGDGVKSRRVDTFGAKERADNWDKRGYSKYNKSCSFDIPNGR